jgi:hypothetical protein
MTTGDQQRNSKPQNQALVLPRFCLLVVVIILSLLVGCAGPGQEQLTLKPRPSTRGLFLPYPTRVPAYHADTTLTTTELIRSIRFTAAVDAKGKIDSLELVRKRDSTIIRFYRDYLTSLRFEPGIRDTVVAPTRIPVVMYVGALGTRPRLLFPVEADRGVVNTDLYQEALELNGILAPTLKAFPSYSCTMFEDYESTSYRLALLRVNLDTDGRPTDVAPVLSTCGGYIDQLRSACLWAEYTPGKIDGKATPFSVWVLVSFLPDIECPTAPLHSEESAMWNLKDRMRVRLYADTIGLASPPLPVRAWSETVPRGEITGLGPGRTSVLFQVDSLGQGSVQMVSPLPKEFRALGEASWACKRIVSRLCSLYPAVDFKGRPQPYSGLMQIELEGEDSIRIWIDWLSDGRFLDAF